MDLTMRLLADSVNPSKTHLSEFAIIGGSPLSQTGDRLSNTGAIRRIGFGTIGDVALLDVFGNPGDLPGRIIEQSLALSGVHLPKEVARLSAPSTTTTAKPIATTM